MKKSIKIVISVVVVIAILILGVSLFFPEAMKDMTSGTFGKAEKYRKTQMTEQDVRLRSEFVNDTAKLREMIQGLIYFALFTEELSNKIDSAVRIFEKRGMTGKVQEQDHFTILKDYAGFIRNSNKTLGATISMLTGFYLKDGSEESGDVEKNLREFGNYVNMLHEKDSILELSLRSMDNFMLNNKAIKSRPEELRQLKSIRDQLVIGGIQIAGILQDKDMAMAVLSNALQSESELQGVLQGVQMGNLVYESKAGDLGFIQKGFEQAMELNLGSVALMKEAIEAQQSGSKIVGAAESFGSAVIGIIIYNQEMNQFVVRSMSDLSSTASAKVLTGVLSFSGNSAFLSQQSKNAAGYEAVAYYSAQAVNLVPIEMNIQSMLSLSNLSSALSGSMNLGFILSSSVQVSAASLCSGFLSFADQVNSIIFI